MTRENKISLPFLFSLFAFTLVIRILVFIDVQFIPGLFRFSILCAILSDFQLGSAHPGFFQRAKDIPGHPLGQFDGREIVMDHNTVDVLAVEAGLIGDGADDISGLDVIFAANLRR